VTEATEQRPLLKQRARRFGSTLARCHDGFCELYLFRALPTLLTLALLEQMLFYGSYAASFLYSWGQRFTFFLQGVALAAVLAVPLALSFQLLRWSAKRVSPIGLLRSAQPTLVAQGLFLLLLGTVVLSNGGGRILRMAPLGHYGLLLFLMALFAGNHLFLTRRWFRPSDSVKLNVMTLAVTVFCSWILLSQRDLYLWGALGLDTPKGRLRTMVLFGVPFVSALGVPWLLAARRAICRRRRWILGLPLLVLATGLLYWNGDFMVDNYLELHSWVSFTTLAIAWLALETLTATGPGDEHETGDGRIPDRGPVSTSWAPPPSHGTSRRQRMGIWVLVAATTLSLWIVGIRSVVGYVGAVHTVFQRFALEVIYDDLPNTVPRLRKLAAYYGEKVLRGRWDQRRRGFVGPLPSTFRRVQPDPTLKRPPLRGVVLILLDMQRPEYLGRYGAGKSITPRIDRCFGDAFVFERAYSAGSSTLVAYPSLYTSTYGASRYQKRHRERKRFHWRAYQRGYNLGTTFQRSGYQTTVLTHDWYWKNQFMSKERRAFYSGFHRVVRQKPGVRRAMPAIRAAYRETPSAIPVRGRYLTVFHLLPHGRTALPGIDRFVGEVCNDLKKRGRWKDTLLLLTADHGVQYREHGRTDYGLTLFDEEVRVPLLVRVPGLQGRRILDAVSSVDHLPTLIDLLRLTAPFRLEGRSYAPVLFGRQLPKSRPLFMETRLAANTVAVLRGHMKLIWWEKTGTMALFDLHRDAREHRNRIEDPAYRSIRRQLEQDLHRFLRERGPP
jgi:hypothetical protein